MRLDAKREREIEKRKGFASRTLITGVWLAICFAFAYLAMNYLFNNTVITENFIRAQLRLPPWVPDWGILVGAMILIVVIVNFFVLIGYAFFSPSGRRRPGQASLYSSDPDRDDHRYDYR